MNVLVHVLLDLGLLADVGDGQAVSIGAVLLVAVGHGRREYSIAGLLHHDLGILRRGVVGHAFGLALRFLFRDGIVVGTRFGVGDRTEARRSAGFDRYRLASLRFRHRHIGCLNGSLSVGLCTAVSRQHEGKVFVSIGSVVALDFLGHLQGRGAIGLDVGVGDGLGGIARFHRTVFIRADGRQCAGLLIG